MNRFPAAALVAVLLLAGCAAPPPHVSGDASASPAATPEPPIPAAPVMQPTVPPRSPAAAANVPQAVDPSVPLQPAAAQAGPRTVAPLAAPVDLWDRIRRGFAMRSLESDLVRSQEQWYAARPDYMQRMTERSRRYLFHIVEELERRQMPSELALLPFVESAFNPQAVSSARAAGMWQFMPATGSFFDLRQNVFRDDRRDVVQSTRAAMDYLQKLYGMFGDWHLALAAYNWGEGSVGRAIARNKAAGGGGSYTELNMPNETRNYVPKLQAIKNIVANPEAFRAELPFIANHPYFQTVDVSRDIDVELAARLADITLEDFRALNPSAHRPVILAAGTPQILLPWDNATIFQRNFDAYNKGQYASWTAWTTSSTMTVAEAARRVGMSEQDLRSLNTIPPRMLIKAGSTLIVPRSARMQADVAEHVADKGQLSLTPEVVTRRTVVKAGKRDTVASIARRYRLRAADVAQWNNVGASAAFKAGEQVVVFLPVKVGKARAARRAAATTGPRATPRPAARAPRIVKKPRR